jgi:hypothetical protein
MKIPGLRVSAELGPAGDAKHMFPGSRVTGCFDENGRSVSDHFDTYCRA